MEVMACNRIRQWDSGTSPENLEKWIIRVAWRAEEKRTQRLDWTQYGQPKHGKADSTNLLSILHSLGPFYNKKDLILSKNDIALCKVPGIVKGSHGMGENVR